jgi:asparagine synthase (glutamine-hydrolysing)
MQAIPFTQRVRPGETRSLLRRALRDILPERIAKRRGKGDPSQFIFSAIAREGKRLRQMFEDARVFTRGYMQPKELIVALDMARHGHLLNHAAILKTLALEFWLRALEHRSSSVKCNAAVGLKYVS